MEAVQWIVSAGTNIFEALQLNEDFFRLRSSLPKAHTLIDLAEWGKLKNKHLLAPLLSQLRDTTCDAEDLLREFDDHVQRQKMEDTERSRAGQLISSSFNFFKLWISGTKARLKEAQSKLDMVVAETKRTLELNGLNVKPTQLGKPLMPERSSVIGVPQVFGRDEERDLVIERLGVTVGRDNVRDQVIELLGVPLTRGGRSSRAAGKKTYVLGTGAVASSSRAAKRQKGESSRSVSTKATNFGIGDVCVMSIVGIGGVGKTTLAQFIYNDPRVKSNFDLTIWVCVSDLFDKKRILNDIIESIPGEVFNPLSSLNNLHKKLMEQLKGQKFLLILDDIWPSAHGEWEEFFAPLRHEHEGSMVLVTTRFLKVADAVSTGIKPVELQGLPADIFWELFKKCAFGEQNAELYPQLQDIGQSIADRLCGSPLAAKTLGRLLSMELTQQHWRKIQSSELWELSHEENEILPALLLSYLYLPQKLKRCFAVCSIFPKDYSFRRDEIVAFWVAQCFTEPNGSMRLEDTGYQYLDDLRSRFLFQAHPMHPGRYVMHDLIHDMARFVSLDECFVMQDLSNRNLQEPPDTIRHMSIEVDNKALSRMRGIQHLNKLHSLRFGMTLEVEVSWFKHLSNILFLSLKGCKLVKLPESICELNRLRCLDMSDSSIKELPEKLWCLYSLQYIFAGSDLNVIHQDVTRLFNLRHLALPRRAATQLSKTSGLGNLLSLQNLIKFTVGKQNGRKIGELKGMNQLSGLLFICSLAHVRSREEAAEARLVEKQYLKDLVLEWRSNSCMLSTGHNGVLEGLHPSKSIESLEIRKFGGDSFSPSWLKPENLPALRSLRIFNCDGFESIVLQSRTPYIEEFTTFADDVLGGSVGSDSTQHAIINESNKIACLPFISLTTIFFYLCRKLKNLDQCLSPEYFPSIRAIQLEFCGSLESLPVHKFGGFVYLQSLKIAHCWRLLCPTEMVLPHSLQKLYISRCNQFDKSLKPGCLQNLASLTFLHLQFCDNLESLLLNSISRNNLKGLVLEYCPKLSSIGGSHALSSIQHVDISACPELTEVEQPLLKKGLRQSELSELQSSLFHMNWKLL